ncbi:DMT family transporter [Pseudahrensia aquimaris]|uniref:DMT family transporter n=1 Tax=Pseudahrensia aquimaris TaxID=744461 RepID=A0ABW3FFN7_9HYPH
MTPSASSPAMNLKTWSLLALLAFIWGGSFLFARIAVLEVPPLTLVFFRVAIAAVALHIYLASRGQRLSGSGGLWLAFAGMGLLNNIIPFSLIFYGQQEIGAGLAAIINAMTPIWTLLIAHRFTADEHLSTSKIVGIVLGFTGVAALIGPDAIGGLSGSTLAQIAVLGATISYGCAGVFGKRFAAVSPVQTATGQLTLSSLIMLPIAAFADRFWFLDLPSLPAILSILALALVCTAFAYILFFRILASSGAVNISLVTLLVPVSAIILGAIVLGETLKPMQFAGMAFILLGLIIIDGRTIRRYT